MLTANHIFGGGRGGTRAPRLAPICRGGCYATDVRSFTLSFSKTISDCGWRLHNDAVLQQSRMKEKRSDLFSAVLNFLYPPCVRFAVSVSDGSSIGSAVFTRAMPHSLHTLHCAVPFKNVFSRGRFCIPHLIVSWAKRPTNPNGISIKSAVFPQYTLVTIEQTDERTRPVRIGRLITLCVRRGIKTGKQSIMTSVAQIMLICRFSWCKRFVLYMHTER